MKTRHKFWIDGMKTEVDSYSDLAEHLIRKAMEYNDREWSEVGKLEYINDWFGYYLKQGEIRPSFYKDVAFDIFMNRILWDKKEEHVMNKRNSRFVVFTMAKKLKEFNPKIQI